MSEKQQNINELDKTKYNYYILYMKIFSCCDKITKVSDKCTIGHTKINTRFQQSPFILSTKMFKMLKIRSVYPNNHIDDGKYRFQLEVNKFYSHCSFRHKLI